MCLKLKMQSELFYLGFSRILIGKLNNLAYDLIEGINYFK